LVNNYQSNIDIVYHNILKFGYLKCQH